MEKLNLCIDIDGTVTEAYDWISLANKYFNTRITPDKVTVYDIDKVLGVSRKAYDQFYQKHGEEIHHESKMRIGVKDVLDQLYKNHWIHFVTARQEKMRDVTFHWFSRHQISFDTLSLLGSHNKVAKAHELKCHIFIEDRLENALQLSSAGFKVLLMDCNYNQGHLNPQITRVKNWYEIAHYIHEQTEQYSFKIAT